MTPRTGVYPYDAALFDILQDSFCGISNRDLLHNIIHDPIREIREAFHNKKSNEFVVRERYRRWQETIEDNIGVWAPTPTWEEVRDNEDWCSMTGLEESLFCDEPEWIIYGDDVDIAYDLNEKLQYAVWMEDDLSRVLAKMLEIKPDIEEMIVGSREQQSFYVVRSPKVENCWDENLGDPIKAGQHILDHLGNGLVAGEYPTYVLSDDLVKMYFDEQKRQEEWERKYEEARLA